MNPDVTCQVLGNRLQLGVFTLPGKGRPTLHVGVGVRLVPGVTTVHDPCPAQPGVERRVKWNDKTTHIDDCVNVDCID